MYALFPHTAYLFDPPFFFMIIYFYCFSYKKIIKMIVTFILINVMASVIVEVSGTSCFRKHLFSTKTPYIFIGDVDEDIIKPNPSCQPIQINMLHRHGHRYPSITDIKRMDIMSKKLNTVNRDVLLDVLKIEELPWKFPFKLAQDKLLTEIGQIELYYVGKQVKKRFPGLFNKTYSPLTYKFQSTCALRSSQSSNALAAGLFEGNGTLGKTKYQPIAITTLPCDNDPILRFIDICKKYIQKASNVKVWEKETYDFQHGDEVNEVLSKVTKKLTMRKSALNTEDLKQIFLACSYELTMLHGTLSKGICSLFDKEDFVVMEYLYDLKQYYKRSAGHPLNYEIACTLLSDIYNSLKEAVDDEEDAYSGIFRSGHAETILPIVTLLGVYLDDIKLTAENFKYMKFRKFRPACIAPFAGNLYFILYKCKDKQYKIQFYLNEKLVKLPCCEGMSDCDFEDFLKCYKDIVDECDLKKTCAV